MPASVLLPGACDLARVTVLAVVALMTAQPAAAAGDRERGAELFRSCAACHSLTPDEHRTGPSLAGIFGREAGAVPGFTRYSPALEHAEVTWSQQTLDAWLANPQAVIPGNRMTFPGIRDEQARADLLAYLQDATAEGPRTDVDGESSDMPDLETLRPDQQVTSIRYCDGTYHVATAAGAEIPFWEFNLRFKTDSSDSGPRKGQPALLPASMMGDRAFVIFADPAEISTSIKARC